MQKLSFYFGFVLSTDGLHKVAGMNRYYDGPFLLRQRRNVVLVALMYQSVNLDLLMRNFQKLLRKFIEHEKKHEFRASPSFRLCR